MRMPSSPTQEQVNDKVSDTFSDVGDGHIRSTNESYLVATVNKDHTEDNSNFVGEKADRTKAAVRSDSFSNEQTGRKQPASKSEPPLLSTIYDGRPFAGLVRTWETYVGESASDQFQPLLNNLCGARQSFSQLEGSIALIYGTDMETQAKLSEPIPLRHIHSTPLVHIPSILDDDEDEQPPIGLEILSRSRSTPLSTSANSAFGTILRPNLPYISGPCDRSAFTMPPYRLKPSQSQESVVPRNSIFNPIQYENDLETTEQTAIEVMDLPSSKPDETGEEGVEGMKGSSRAAKFLSEVRNLRRPRKVRDGRENPAQPASVSESSKKKGENASLDEETLSSKSSANSDANKQVTKARESNLMEMDSKQSIHSTVVNRSLGRDHDTTLRHACPTTFPVSTYQPVEDQNHSSKTERVRIQVSSTKALDVLVNDRGPYSSASPEPSHHQDVVSLTPQSHDSPETFLSSGTTLTSGHTTQGTATTYSSGHVSNLSVISETDLEVMQVNKAGKLLRAHVDQAGRIAPAPSTTQIQLPGYIEVSDSPTCLREGARVPIERFFTLAESPIDKRGPGVRLRSASSLRRSSTVNSPNTVSSSSMTTSSSASSQDEPPTFVSYLDRKMTSDLTSLREMDERTSPRGGANGRGERGSSPTELLGYSGCTFEEAQAPLGSKALPRPIWPTKGFQFGRKVRSLPPRSPHKGAITPTTPPPRGGGASPCYDAISPPRHIVDHRIDPSVSRPYVLRSTPVSARLLSTHKVSPEVLSSRGNVNYAHIPDVNTEQGGYEIVRIGTDQNLSNHYYTTQSRGVSPQSYHEQSIEVQKVDSNEESS